MKELFFPSRCYNLEVTLTSGQAFRWQRLDGEWSGVIGNRWVGLKQWPGGILARTIQRDEDWRWLVHYLQLPSELEPILQSFPRDCHMEAALRCCSGLRLLRQDPWECLASFILSSTKQIVQIQQIIRLVCQRWGETVAAPLSLPRFASFPRPDIIARLSEAELRECKMGFRARYLKETAARVASGAIDLSQLHCLTIEPARQRLMELPGVGRKIADCVLLFAYGFPAAFPIDVWIRKALTDLYFRGRKVAPEKLEAFAASYFGPHAGLAQQYLFHYMRLHQPGRK